MKNDISTGEFFSDAARYADLINGLGCGGRQIVRQEDIGEADARISVWQRTAKGSRKKYKERDLVRRTAFGINFMVIGIENQETIDYLLPLRGMLYEAGEYEKQAAQIRKQVRREKKALSAGEYLYGFTKESRLHPSVTFVLYYGKEEWDGARNLHRILDFTDIPEGLRELVQDYNIHVVEIRKLEATEIFRTDVRQVFDFIRYSEDSKKLKELLEQEEGYRELEEDAYDMVALYTKSDNLAAKKEYYMKEGKVNMCGALEALIEEGRSEGRSEGLELGLRAMIETCQEMGLDREDTLNRVEKKMTLTREDAEGYMEEYWKE